jgi:hypothetical protein
MTASLRILAVVSISFAVASLCYPDLLRWNAVPCTIWAVCVTTVFVISARLARKLLPAADWLLRLVATLALAEAASAAVVTWAGWAGELSSTTELIAVGLGAALASVRRGEPRVDEPESDAGPNAPPGPIGRAALVLIILACLQLGWDLVRYLPVDSDNMWYHFPMVAEWVRSASIRPTYAIPTIARGYPGFREAFMTFLTLPVGTEHLAIPGLLELPAIALVCARLALEFRIPSPVAWAASAYTLTAPQVALSGNGNDLCLALQLVTAILFLTRFTARSDRGDAALSGVALGALAATKYSGLIYAGMLVSLFGVDQLLRRWRAGESVLSGLVIRHWLLAAAVALTLSGPWYVRNLLIFGNPLYPARIVVGTTVVFPGPFDRAYFAPKTLGWDIRPLIDHSHHFREAFGRLIPLIGFGVIAVGLGSFVRPQFLARHWPLLALPVGLLGAFLHQPYNRPSFGYDYNMRYLIGWFAVSLTAVLLVLRAAPLIVTTIAAAVLVAGAVENVSGWSAWWKVYAIAAVSAAILTRLTSGSSLPRLVAPSVRSVVVGTATFVAALTLAAAGVASLRARNQYTADYGYRDSPSSKGWGPVARFVHAKLSGHHVAVIGDDRFFPMYGDRFSNSVTLVPYRENVDDLLASCRAVGATAVVCLNPIASRRSARDYQFNASAGPEMMRLRPEQVRKLFEADGAFVLELMSTGQSESGKTTPRSRGSRALQEQL